MRLAQRLSTTALLLATLAPESLRSQAASPSTLPRLDDKGVSYLGSFTVPDSDGAGGDLTFGSLLGLGAAGKSLIWADHSHKKGVCEVSIPEINERATIVQRCAEVDEGMLAQIRPGGQDTSIVGALPWNGRIIWSATSFYDADGSARYSHFVSGPNFSTSGDVRGPYRVGNTLPPAAVGGYFGIVPEEWRAALGGPVLGGNCCLSIISRTSSGPALTAFNPDDLGRVTPVPATALLYYPLSQPLANGDTQNALYNLTTQVAGFAFPAGTRSVLFITRHGTGPVCYGPAGSGPGAKCPPDPISDAQGYHANPYVHQVLAYDAVDLAKVKGDDQELWQPRPYATWKLTEMNNNGAATLAGSAYDPSTRRWYIVEQYAGAGDSVVHVYQLLAPAPSPTDNNRAVPRPRPGSPPDHAR